MSTVINTRSPFYFKVANPALAEAKIEIYIWTGTNTQRRRNNKKYTLRKAMVLDEIGGGITTSATTDKLVDSTQNFTTSARVGGAVTNMDDDPTITTSITAIDNNTTLSLSNSLFIENEQYKLFAEPYVVFELSEFIRDFMITEYGNYSTDTLWIEADVTLFNSSAVVIPISGQQITTTQFLGIDGYGYFENGSNPRSTQYSTPMVMQDNTTVYFNEGQDIRIPVFAEAATITVQLDSGAGANVFWNAADDFWDTYDVGWGAGANDVIINDNGNTNQKIQYLIITDTQNLAGGDTLTFSSSIAAIPNIVITLEKVCEPRYIPMNIIFYNKYGALQNIWFFKKSSKNININSEKFNSNILNIDNTGGVPNYSLTEHEEKKFMVNGKESITVNTGFYIEEYNEIIKQMLLSELVWIYDLTLTLPINLKSNSLSFKKSVNEKLITYGISFDYANNKINNIL